MFLSCLLLYLQSCLKLLPAVTTSSFQDKFSTWDLRAGSVRETCWKCTSPKSAELSSQNTGDKSAVTPKYSWRRILVVSRLCSCLIPTALTRTAVVFSIFLSLKQLQDGQLWPGCEMPQLHIVWISVQTFPSQTQEDPALIISIVFWKYLKGRSLSAISVDTMLLFKTKK